MTNNGSKLDPAAQWQAEYARTADKRPRCNRSGIVLKPLYTPSDWDGSRYAEDVGYPGQEPYTRGIYPAMYRGREWSRRMLIGLGTPEDFNRRQKKMLATGTTAVNFIPCNSVFRGYDIDDVDPLLVGTCGTAVNTLEDMRIAMDGIELGDVSLGMNDPSPFTLLALILVLAKERGTPWEKLSGTSNQADFISHFVANHMFYRLSLEGSRRVLLDHIVFTTKYMPRWNPLSIVGQHMQQAGATPAQALGFTLSSALYYVDLCVKAGMDPDSFVHRFTFFFDISMSFFEEVAKFRAGRRLWARLLKERFGIRNPVSLRFKFHAQTSGVDLTRQQPLNNIARVAVQGLAAILGGTQSLHTDAYDEAFATPSPETARIAIQTQNILSEESGVADVIDPLCGSYYIETLTDEMEQKAREVISRVDQLGGMFEAARAGYVQSEIGKSANEFQARVEKSQQTVVGVNKYQLPEEECSRAAAQRPDPDLIAAQYDRLRRYKAGRSQISVGNALEYLARATDDKQINLYEALVKAAEAGATHGEMVKTLRTKLGFGRPHDEIAGVL
jgi:methylmalonyl-CoA mutase N-terminal domain/subunit